MGGFIATLTDPEELYLIVNPHAGGGRAARVWRQLQQTYKWLGTAAPVAFTTGLNHATQLARDAFDQGYRKIAVLGGDGTLNETINGLIRDDQLADPQLRVFFLGAGSSCDVQKLFPDRRPLADRLRWGVEYCSDVMKAACYSPEGRPVIRYFLANSSIGVISAAVARFNQNTPLLRFLKRTQIDLAVVTAGLQTIFRFGDFSARIRAGSQAEYSGDLKNITIFKTPYFGGGMNYGVQTSHDDGLLRVAAISALNRWSTLALIPALYRGTILRHSAASFFSATDLTIESPTPGLVIEADGEMIGRLPCRYTILPRRLTLVL